jgi:raffinose/stachyose/melibiose transport system permease protein
VRTNSIKRMITGYVFLIPAALFLAVFFFYPIVNSVIMSLTNWSGFSNDYEFIGFDNYIHLFTANEYFWDALVVNLKFAVTSSVIQTILGFLLAFLLINMTKRWQSFYKISLFLPVLIPAATVGVMWTFIFSPEAGLLNQFLGAIGLESWQHGWVKEYSTALGSVIGVNTWRNVGITMVIYFITMLTISKEITEAVTIDGGNKYHLLRYIYIPLTWFATQINFLLSIIGGMKAFDLFYLLTGGGPGRETEVTAMLIYRTAFKNYEFSKALTMSLVLFMSILLLTIVVNRILKTKE